MSTFFTQTDIFFLMCCSAHRFTCTLYSTVYSTIYSTIYSTLYSTIYSTLYSTIYSTLYSTIYSTVYSTIYSTLYSTIYSTLYSTIYSTLYSTLYRNRQLFHVKRLFHMLNMHVFQLHKEVTKCCLYHIHLDHDIHFIAFVFSVQKALFDIVSVFRLCFVQRF